MNKICNPETRNYVVFSKSRSRGTWLACGRWRDPREAAQKADQFANGCVVDLLSGRLSYAKRHGVCSRALPKGLTIADIALEVYRDLGVENHGSIVLVRPYSDAGAQWLQEHCPQDDNHQYFGNALVVEPRYLENLLLGIGGDGLTI